MTHTKSIHEFIDDEYKTYSMYVLENRAIPSAIDGQKPVFRKLLYSMLQNGGKRLKIAELGGSLSSVGYHHGESSAQQAAITMTRAWSNNLPLFDGHGNFGSRMVPDAAAPRYIYASLSKNFGKYFSDIECCPTVDDEEHPEPLHYLPIIPWVLVNGIKGIAVGFATEILPRSAENLAKAVLQVVNGKKVDPLLLKPVFPDFKGEVVHVVDNTWKTVGIVSIDKNLRYTISELPIGFDRETYVNYLNKLVDDSKINDYDDYCSEKGFEFVIHVNRAQKAVIDKNPITYFKLEKQFTENITTIGHDGKLKLFDNAEQLLYYFVEYRLEKLQNKIDYEIVKKSQKIDFLRGKIRFIKDVITEKIDFKKMTKQDLISYCLTFRNVEADVQKYISIPIFDCTKDRVQKLEEELLSVENELKEWQAEEPKSLYKKRLKQI